mgnify:CR=1 FL=1
MLVSYVFNAATKYSADKKGNINAYHSRLGLPGCDNLHFASKGKEC